ncbi:hypothetical protein Pcinc_017984 [Petrolisthes cinctipes]|uniref:Uncharacterized protein n=1 Tax=Petrolisthes cinctipes TaxID=88211 RepID=A0AAE1KJU3_PETCI|nr:hypothetical protein Pcinc_017984 [Petrolisthes cinctipes]
MIGGKFAPLLLLEDNDVESATNAFNIAIIDTATEILGNCHHPKKPWVTAEILELFDKRRKLKNKRNNPEGDHEYRQMNIRVRREMKRAKETWIENQCKEIDENLKRNNNKNAYQLVKDLTSKKQGRATTIQDKSGKCLYEETEMMDRILL